MALILQKDSLDVPSGNCKSLREQVEIRNSFFKFLLASSLLLTHWPKQVTCSSPGSALESTISELIWMQECAKVCVMGAINLPLKGKNIPPFFLKKHLIQRMPILRHTSWYKYCAKQI